MTYKPQAVADLLAQLSEKLKGSKTKTSSVMVLFSNGTGHVISSSKLTKFNTVNEAALLMTHPDLFDHEALTPAQERLYKKHGTPHQFAGAVQRALGEISLDEAREAVDKYNSEWFAAGAAR